ncbi:MAG: LysE family transporter [Bryobacteraceae bacterium]
MTASVLRGAWLGFCIAAPIGPIGVLVMKQAIQRGPGAGLASGFGAALADLIYGFLAAGGVRLAAGYGRVVGATGGAILLCIAYRLWNEPPSRDTVSGGGTSRLGGTFTTFFLTLSNPMTILSFAAMVASAGTDAPLQFVTGVFLGSLLWWAILSLTAVWLRVWIEFRGAILNRLSAVTIACFGLWAIWTKGLN